MIKLSYRWVLMDSVPAWYEEYQRQLQLIADLAPLKRMSLEDMQGVSVDGHGHLRRDKRRACPTSSNSVD